MPALVRFFEVRSPSTRILEPDECDDESAG